MGILGISEREGKFSYNRPKDQENFDHYLDLPSHSRGWGTQSQAGVLPKVHLRARSSPGVGVDR
jgi:hypothetical protein